MAKNYQRLWEDVTGANDEAAAVRALADIVVDKDGRVFISRLDRESAEYCINILDRGIAEHKLKLTTTEKQAFFVSLRRLAGTRGRLPDSMMITEEVEVEGEVLARGGFADIRVGTYMSHRVAVKKLKIALTDDINLIRKRFCREVVLWSTVSHPNILKLAGVQGDMGKGEFVTISEWMVHGNIMDYIRKNRVNRLELLHGAAQGLKYLHDVGLAHGDLKGANILMSNDDPPRACLADFGFMTVVLDPNQPMSCSAQLEGGTMTFMSPELLVPSKFGVTNPIPTPEADVYAFGLVVFQVLTGETPFRNVRQMEIGFSVVKGVRPDKPENASTIGFSDSLWDFVQRCWDGGMISRPRVIEVVEHLARAAAGWRGSMPPCVQVEIVGCVSEEQESGTMAHGAIFQDRSSEVPGSPTNSQSSSSPSSSLGTLSTARTELSLEEPREILIKPPAEPPTSRGSNARRPTPEVQDDLREAQHLAYNFPPPPSALPPPKRKPFQSVKAKFRKLLYFFH